MPHTVSGASPVGRLAAATSATSVTLAIVLVGACTASSPEQDAADQAGLSDLPQPTVVASASTPDPLPPPEVAEATAPALARDEPAWKAPFDDVPIPAEEMLVGLIFPTDEQSDVSVIGVDPSGSTRWTVRTNPSCIGYGVTEVDGHMAAVVLASDADNRNGKVASVTTANAYDVTDGTRLWGPAPVPGPLQGPGLIFGEVEATVVGGDSGPKQMLAASTGEPVEPPTDGAVPVYEHHGVGLFGHDGVLTAVDTASGRALWSSGEIDAPSGWFPEDGTAELLESTLASDEGVVAVRWSSGGDERTSLHHLRTGELVAELGDETEFRTVVDHGSHTVVVSGLDGFRVTRAYDLGSRTLRWDNSGEDSLLEITVVRSGVGYGTEGGVSVAVDLASGRRLEQGDQPVPVAVSDAGALVTALPQDPGSGPTDRTAGAGPGYVVHFAR